VGGLTACTYPVPLATLKPHHNTKTMNITSIILALLAMLTFSQRSEGSTSTINFDDYPYGRLTFASSNRYQSVGVLFNRDIPIYSVAAMEASWWVNIFTNGGGTVPNVMGLSSSIDPRTTIEMRFVFPGTTNPATTDLVGADFFDSEVGSLTGTFQAFDVNGNPIGSITPTTPASCKSRVQFSTPGIARVRFSDTGDGFETDNIFFNMPVAQSGPKLNIIKSHISQVDLSWQSRSNKTYQIKYQSTLTTNGWLDLGAPVLGNGFTNFMQDSIIEGQSSRFYRLVEQ